MTDRRSVRPAHRPAFWAVCVAGLACLFLLACTFAPYAPRDPNSLAPQGESEPVVGADPNPLDDRDGDLFVICAPQGGPLIENAATRECEADPDCRVRCTDDPERALENGR